MLIESDKRNKKYAIPLMYSKEKEEPFYIPPNIYIIGLMNLADRSLALVDYALRRRFSFFTLEPKFDSNEYQQWLDERNMSQELINLIVKKMDTLNQEIANDELLGIHYQIGHSYFCPNKSDFSNLDKDWYSKIIKTEIVPLIREYWFDDPDRVEDIKNKLLLT